MTSARPKLSGPGHILIAIQHPELAPDSGMLAWSIEHMTVCHGWTEEQIATANCYVDHRTEHEEGRLTLAHHHLADADAIALVVEQTMLAPLAKLGLLALLRAIEDQTHSFSTSDEDIGCSEDGWHLSSHEMWQDELKRAERRLVKRAKTLPVPGYDSV